MDFSEVEAIAKRALADGKLTRLEIEELGRAIDSDGVFTPLEEDLLKDIVDRYTQGKIEIEIEP